MTNETGFALTPAQKKRFIRELTKSVADSIIRSIPEMPAYWNGHELRQYVADQFAHQIHPMKGQRMCDYRNTIATTTL